MLLRASSNLWYSGISNLQGLEDHAKSDDLSPKEQEENLRSEKSISIKREKQDSALDNINALPVIKSTCGLSRLPNELLDMIFQSLDIKDVFVLGLQCQNFWNVAQKHIRAYLAFPCGIWAGNRIICVGDYTESKDYPPNVLTESEKAKFEGGLSESESGDEDYEHFFSNLYGLADARYQEVREWQSNLARELIGHAFELGEWHRLPKSSRSQISNDLLGYKLSDLYPEDQPWVLRNLTTHEYVRSEAVAIKPEHIHGPNIDFFGFAQVLCSRICWSTTGWSKDRDTHRGVWAGHRFDITTLDRLKQGAMECTEWKDVSEEVMNEMEIVFSESLGSNWRDILQRQFTSVGFGERG